jgi:hypothetical protein
MSQPVAGGDLRVRLRVLNGDEKRDDSIARVIALHEEQPT